MGGVLAVGDGFPDNLAIVGDAFLKSCEFFCGRRGTALIK